MTLAVGTAVGQRTALYGSSRVLTESGPGTPLDCADSAHTAQIPVACTTASNPRGGT